MRKFDTGKVFPLKCVGQGGKNLQRRQGLDIKAFLRLMKQSWRGGGVKIQRTEHRGLWDSFFITGAGWALLIPKEYCPSEITGQIVTWQADMPKIGESKWVAKGCGPQDIPEGDKVTDLSRYTAGTYETGMPDAE